MSESDSLRVEDISWSVDDALIVLDGERSTEKEGDGSEGRRDDEVSPNATKKRMRVESRLTDRGSRARRVI